MNPYVSWAIVLTLIGLSSWYYTGRPTFLSRLSAPTSKPLNDDRSSNSRARKKLKTKKDASSDDNKIMNKHLDEELAKSSEAPVSKKRKIAAQPVVDVKLTAPDHVQAPRTEPEAEESNQAFADRMSKVQAGNTLKAAEKPGISKKERRAQKVVNAKPSASPVTSTGPSSSAGGDADDDMSPVTSPPLDASKTEATKSGDVSDMLEAGPGGPSVLRLTGDIPTGHGKRSTEAPFQAAETKKQRQARARRERQKEEIAEAEKQRKALMEKQMRLARQADGSSKQLKANAFNATPNVWSQKPALKSNGGQGETGEKKIVPLLDTFEETPRSAEIQEPPKVEDAEAVKAPSAPSTNVNGTLNPTEINQSSTSIQQRESDSVPCADATHPATQAGPSSRKPLDAAARKENVAPGAANVEEKLSWADDLPTEEEQLRRLRGTTEEDSWNVVTSRKDKKKVSQAKAANENSSIESSSDAPAVNSHVSYGKGQQKIVAPSVAKSNKGNGFASLAIPTSGDGFQDSDWEA